MENSGPADGRSGFNAVEFFCQLVAAKLHSTGSMLTQLVRLLLDTVKLFPNPGGRQ
jgi:hypothetical protein